MALEIEKKVKGAVLYTNGYLRIDRVRASFPNVAKPRKGTNDDGKDTEKYGTVGLLEKAGGREAKALCVEVTNRILKENKDAKVAKDKKFIKDGDDAGREEYEGSWSISAREDRTPRVRDAKGRLIEDIREIEELIYAGCYVNILIRPWFQDNKYGKRVNAGLVAVQFCDDGEPFGQGRVDDSDAWDTDGADFDDDEL